MLQSVYKQGEWTCLCNTESPYFQILQDYFSGDGAIESLLHSFENLPEVLKDNHRSRVLKGIIELGDHHVLAVAKSPLDKDRRKWSRIISLFSLGEAATTLLNLQRMELAKVESSRPICAVEKRRSKMVVESWICYEFREGVACDATSLDDITALLRQMHRAGFRHDDPTWNNFLRSQSGTLFTIDTKAKPCSGMYHATRDFIALRQANCIYDIDIEALGELDIASFGYKAATLYAAYKSIRTRIKDRLKKNRPKNQ